MYYMVQSITWANGIEDVIQSDDRQWPLEISVILYIAMALGPKNLDFWPELNIFSNNLAYYC